MISPGHPSSDSELTVPGERLRRSWWPVAVALALLVGLTGGGVASGRIVLVGMLLPIVVLLCQSRRVARPVRLSATGQGLTIDEEPPIAADTIAEVSRVYRKPGYPEIRLVLRDGSTRWLRLATEDARSLFRRLGVEEGERRASFPLLPAFRQRFVAVALLSGLASLCFFWIPLAHVRFQELVGLGLFLIFWTIGVIAPLGALIAWLVGAILRGEVVVGADGFTIRWPWRSQFFPFREVERVMPHPRSFEQVLVLLRGMPSLTLTPRDQLGSTDVATALENHLRGAFQRWSEIAAQGASTEALARGGDQDTAAWLQSLDARTREQAHYRVAAPAAAGLAELLQNPAADPEERVAAAVALLRRGDEASRARVRVATDGCASPALRTTLLALEEARSDEDFLEALALHSPPGGARRR